MSKINFKLIDGEPVCLSEYCPRFETCPFVLQGSITCLPGVRQQRDEAQGRESELKNFAYGVQHHRRDCWDYDDDMGYERRDFIDEEEWDRLSEQAERLLARHEEVSQP